MNAGDFTTLAEDYAKHRPDYSPVVLQALTRYVGAGTPRFRVADIGAGTGLWTKMLSQSGLTVTAVEPNDAMRAQGQIYTGEDVIWRKGCAEATGLETGSQDWVTMASSFHWVEQPDGLCELSRILKPGGFLSVLWNPRHVEADPLQQQVETLLYEMIPHLKRVSSGASSHARDYYSELTATGEFCEVVFFEANHRIAMSQERYLGAWRSVNDVQRQAGPERWPQVIDAIAALIAPLDQVVVPYRTRVWTAQKSAKE